MTSYEGEKLLPNDNQNTRLCRFCCTHSCQSPAVVVNANWLGFRRCIALGHEMDRAKQLRLIRKASSHSISFLNSRTMGGNNTSEQNSNGQGTSVSPITGVEKFPQFPNPPTLHPANDSSVSVDCSRHGAERYPISNRVIVCMR